MVENEFELSFYHWSDYHEEVIYYYSQEFKMHLVCHWGPILFVAGIHFFEWIRKNSSSFRWMKEYYSIVDITVP